MTELDNAPTLEELVEYLTSSSDVIRVNAAAYLQHVTYCNDQVKVRLV